MLFWKLFLPAMQTFLDLVLKNAECGKKMLTVFQ